MARIQNPFDNQEVQLEENEELVSIDEVVSKPLEQDLQSNDEVTSTATEEPTAEEVPEKYKDKSLEDVVRMHQEAEKLLGRQSSEVGDLRKSVDDLLKSKLNEASSTKEVEPELDFYEDPKGSVSRAVEGSETVKQMRELLVKQHEQDFLNRLVTKHPTWKETIQGSNFEEWINKSQVRSELLQRADNYDFNAADELLSNWKEIKGVVEKTESLNEKDRKLQVKAASTGGKGSGESMSRKIYKRSEIVNLMINDPQKYAANVEVFDKAYAEGRVK